jgi:GTP-binding protein
VAVVDFEDIVLADIPGLIEGAHQGVGLGLTFLRHIERTRLLIHILNGLSPDPVGDYYAINQELGLFKPQLADKPQLVAFNKMDLPDVQERWPEVQKTLADAGVEAVAVSAATGENVQTLLRKAISLLSTLPPPVREEQPIVLEPVDEDVFTIEQVTEGWIVRGKRIERAAAMTNWDYYEAIFRFQRILEAMGITQALEDAGVQEGDTVFIGDIIDLNWSYEYFAE